jgi:K+-transporting ATPase ATPase C chain
MATHVSPENARPQVARAAVLLEQHVEGREFGMPGEPWVKVLWLNRALEALR